MSCSLPELFDGLPGSFRAHFSRSLPYKSATAHLTELTLGCHRGNSSCTQLEYRLMEMRSSLGGRRRPRKIGQDSDEEGEVKMGVVLDQPDGKLTSNAGLLTSLSDGVRFSRLTAFADSPSPVIRPSVRNKKNRSSLRTSFGPGGTSMAEEEEEPTTVFTPKKSALSKQASERDSLRKSLAAAKISADQVPIRNAEDRPSYSADSLNELRSSTPSTPKDLASRSDVELEHRTNLDLATKFGSDYGSRLSSAIPTNAEIQEKKQRRARLAKEHNFISLDSDNEQGDDLDQQNSDESDEERSLLPYAQSKASRGEESRLVRDDEDIAEGFDEFVEDGRIALGRKAQKEQKQRHKAEMQAMIEEAEGQDRFDDSSEYESDRERKAAYEIAQTKAGMDGLKKEGPGAQPKRPRTPPKITPLPTLSGCAEKLEAQLARKQYAKQQKMLRLEEVQKELADIAARKTEVQRLLDEAAENYRRLRAEAGLQDPLSMEVPRLDNGSMTDIEQMRQAASQGMPGTGLGMNSRGLENLNDI